MRKSESVAMGLRTSVGLGTVNIRALLSSPPLIIHVPLGLSASKNLLVSFTRFHHPVLLALGLRSYSVALSSYPQNGSLSDGERVWPFDIVDMGFHTLACAARVRAKGLFTLL